MTPLQDQLNAILTAPIPFIVVLVAATAVAWRALDWLYKSVIEKTKTLFELSRSEVELKTQVAARIEGELIEG